MTKKVEKNSIYTTILTFLTITFFCLVSFSNFCSPNNK